LKHLPTTILGLFLIIVAAFLVPMDMYFSTYEHYKYDLQIWHVIVIGVAGIGFVYLNPKDINTYLKRFLNKKTK
jgi:hypothetical protein